jgi:dihydrofolate reductase
MSKIIYGADITLDGVVEGPEKWRFGYTSPGLQAYDASKVNSLHGMLLGRKTYEGFATFWPTQTHNEYGIASKLNGAPKYVVSSTLQKAEWNNTTIVKGKDLEESIRKLKEQTEGNIGITGSISLSQALMRCNMIDEFDLLIFPLVLGAGRRIFNEGTNIPMELIDTKSFDRGVVLSRYTPVGKK